jgi:hypothetical protein
MNKRILAMAMAVVCALTMLTACGSKEETTPAPDSAFSVDLNRFYTEIMDAAEEGPMMMDLTADAELLEVMYPGLGAVETKQLVLASPAMSAVAVEFAFAEVANAADVETVKNAFQTRIDTQVAGGAWYPETIEGWKNNSEIVVIDNYVCLFVTSDKDILVDAFRNGTEVGEWAKAPVDLFNFVGQLAMHFGENFPANACLSDMPEMLDMAYPGLRDITTFQLQVYQPMMGAVVCEIALVEVAEAADVARVKEIFQGRIDAQVAGGAWYPASIEGWEKDSRIVENGNFVMMIAFSECDEVVSMFNDLF